MVFIPSGILTPGQERELEKVNAFYLQKEAEVCRQAIGGCYLCALTHDYRYSSKYGSRPC